MKIKEIMEDLGKAILQRKLEWGMKQKQLGKTFMPLYCLYQ